MIVQVLFGKTHILQGDSVLAALEFQKLVNPNPTHGCFQYKGMSARNPNFNVPADTNKSVKKLSSDLAFNEIDDRVNGKQVSDIIDIRVFFKFSQVGMGHFVLEFCQSLFGKLSAAYEF